MPDSSCGRLTEAALRESAYPSSYHSSVASELFVNLSCVQFPPNIPSMVSSHFDVVSLIEMFCFSSFWCYGSVLVLLILLIFINKQVNK